MIVNDLWGQIEIEPGYDKIINSKEFNDLNNKTQLGLNTNPNAIHTRYQHSFGTYHLACILVALCKNKYSNILNVTKEDEQAIKCMALVHDVGHGCFSHVSEKYFDESHENRAVAILKNPDSEINQAILSSFGEKTLIKTIELIEMKKEIKANSNINNEKDLSFLLLKLLSGGIDIDKIDYIFRDSKFIKGETNDFSNLLKSFELECIDNSLEIVFDESVEFALVGFFNKRFELYDSVYLNNSTKTLESVFGKFLAKIDKKITSNTTEIEMKNIFREQLCNSDETIRRYAELLNAKKLDDKFIIKELNDDNKYQFYKTKLLSLVPELIEYSDCLFESYSKINIYDENKKVYINKGGIIQEQSECSTFFNPNLKKQKYVIAIDTLLLTKQLKRDNVAIDKIDKILKKLKKATAIEIEQEKKYIFLDDKTINPEAEFQKMAELLNCKKPEKICNKDTYYDDHNILGKYRIAVRKRIADGVEEWNVKSPLKDKSSILKRNEKNFNSMEEALLFLQNEWEMPVRELKEVITLKTNRTKYDIEYKGGTFEIVFDKTIPEIGEKTYDVNYMIECELKKGNSSGLYFIDELMKKNASIKECELSKKEIALSRTKGDTREPTYDIKYAETINKIFIANPKLQDALKRLDIKKEDVKRLKSQYGNLETPIVITVSGTPRAGKTTLVNNLYDFLKKTDLETVCLDEPAGIIYSHLKNREEKKQLLSDRVGFVEQQYKIGQDYINNNIKKSEVIICDRGAIDPFIWFDMYYNMGMIDENSYKLFLNKLKSKPNYYNYFYALFTDCNQSLIRDYNSSLSIEPRTTMTPENIDRYNDAMLRTYPYIESNMDLSKIIDTSKKERIDASIEVANDVLENIKKLYLKRR